MAESPARIRPSSGKEGWSGLPLTQQDLLINARPFVPSTVGRRQANNTAAYNALSHGMLEASTEDVAFTLGLKKRVTNYF